MPIGSKGGRPNRGKRDSRLSRISEEYILALSDNHFDQLKEAVKGDEYDPEIEAIASLNIWEYIMGKDEDWLEEVRGE